MADFITSKVDGNSVGASEWNQLADIDNAIITSGQTPSTGNLNQLGNAMANYAAQGSVYGTDSGVADAYIITQISPFRAPTALTDGMTIKFRPANTNTGASTVNPFGLGVTDIKKKDGITDLIAGDIADDTDLELRYDLANTAFIIVSEVVTDQAWVKIASATPSAVATVDFTDLSSTYAAYKIVLDCVKPSTNAVYLLLRVSTDNGSTFAAGTSYRWTNQNITSNGASNLDYSASEQSGIALSGIDGGATVSSSYHWSGEVLITNPSNSSNLQLVSYQAAYMDSGSGATTNSVGSGMYNATTAVNAIRFLFSSGNITSGIITLYGLKA